MKTYIYAGSALALLTIIGALGVSQVRPSVAPPPLAAAGTSAPDAPTRPDVQAARIAGAAGAGSARSNPALPADPDALPADLPLQLASVSGPAGTPQQACRGPSSRYTPTNAIGLPDSSDRNAWSFSC